MNKFNWKETVQKIVHISDNMNYWISYEPMDSIDAEDSFYELRRLAFKMKQETNKIQAYWDEKEEKACRESRREFIRRGLR